MLAIAFVWGGWLEIRPPQGESTVQRMVFRVSEVLVRASCSKSRKYVDAERHTCAAPQCWWGSLVEALECMRILISPDTIYNNFLRAAHLYKRCAIPGNSSRLNGSRLCECPTTALAHYNITDNLSTLAIWLHWSSEQIPWLKRRGELLTILMSFTVHSTLLSMTELSRS